MEVYTVKKCDSSSVYVPEPCHFFRRGRQIAEPPVFPETTWIQQMDEQKHAADHTERQNLRRRHAVDRRVV